MKSIIVDTSVVTKWYSQEKESDLERAFNLLEFVSQEKIRLVSPKIILLELANALCFGKRLDQKGCLESVEALKNLCAELIEKQNIRLLTEIMYKHKLTSYDATFISLALEKKLPLITADYKHHKKSISPQIVWLSEWTG